MQLNIILFRWEYRLTHWGRVTHICVGKLIIIGSDHGLSPGRRHAMISTNVVIWSMGLLITNFSEIFIEIHTFSFKKMHLKMSSAKWCLFCFDLNVLIYLDFAVIFTYFLHLMWCHWNWIQSVVEKNNTNDGCVVLKTTSDKVFDFWISVTPKISPCL